MLLYMKCLEHACHTISIQLLPLSSNTVSSMEQGVAGRFC
jgi:hypothetical protein